MGIELRPRFDVRDARLVRSDRVDDEAPAPNAPARPSAPALGHFVNSATPLVIEYNPTRPRGRLRYSLAHELAHALFVDAGEATRHRTPMGAVGQMATDDSWQLELLCNVAAAELLMPAAEVEGLVNIDTDIDFLMVQRKRFNVSTEALLRRLVHASVRPMALGAFSRVEESASSSLRCEYVLGSRTWSGSLRPGALFGPGSPLADASAVGVTARGEVTAANEAMAVQAVGIPSYPGSIFPRVLALFEPLGASRTAPDALRFVTADIATAADAAQKAPVVVAHVVSDGARAWGNRGVAAALKRRFPDAAAAFRAWTIASPENLGLGHVHVVDTASASGEPSVGVASMVVQRGYGPSASPRLSYVALAQALEEVARVAANRGAEVHIPRIGAGQAGGRWDLIQATIERTLLAHGISTVVYTQGQVDKPQQGSQPAGESRR
ncbi:ImmA/IrrE family metallo-endopeptidase [Kribbella sp. CA-293567]|uniref:ImmA/IrrE family metallo-endopeptidase n=1 Tax=Kribbella sp. CA-293567 TaxID=3002436 RepID=UPI0022DE02E9|nr:ImmA/IrrE family metallo-endopeptidase [Kribbella sp. CA-293567]WBQ08709.1 ImmA/IrrE family metallo-endopeptidase [Kribbella sp. CA-293567]